jgi:hypothetical protein
MNSQLLEQQQATQLLEKRLEASVALAVRKSFACVYGLLATTVLFTSIGAFFMGCIYVIDVQQPEQESNELPQSPKELGGRNDDQRGNTKTPNGPGHEEEPTHVENYLVTPRSHLPSTRNAQVGQVSDRKEKKTERQSQLQQWYQLAVVGPILDVFIELPGDDGGSEHKPKSSKSEVLDICLIKRSSHDSRDFEEDSHEQSCEGKNNRWKHDHPFDSGVFVRLLDVSEARLAAALSKRC